MRKVADQYKPLYVFFVIHGPDQSPPFEFRKVNLETSEVEYSVVEDTQPTWRRHGKSWMVKGQSASPKRRQ